MAGIEAPGRGVAATANVPRPIFIIGAPRSGTSVLTWALGQLPNVQPMPETSWIASMAVGAFLSHRKGSERGRFSHLSNVAFPQDDFLRHVGPSVDAIVRDAYARRCHAMYGEAADSPAWRLNARQARNPLQIRRRGDDPKQRWIDGTPLNNHYLWAIDKLFPEARYIHSLRRPDEVATSLERFDRVGAEPQDLEDGLRTWISHTENAWFAERAFGSGRVLRVDFDRIGDDAEALLREVCEFLGEPWSPDCLVPLRKKINSSQVDGQREGNLELLRESVVFQTAEALYDTVQSQPGGENADEDALGIIHQRFLDYCHGRSLV